MTLVSGQDEEIKVFARFMVDTRVIIIKTIGYYVELDNNFFYRTIVF